MKFACQHCHTKYTVDDARGRPAVVLVHGYLCGQWSLEERLWPLRAFARWGFDVALLVLPFHAGRGASFTRPPFPGAPRSPRFRARCGSRTRGRLGRRRP